MAVSFWRGLNLHDYALIFMPRGRRRKAKEASAPKFRTATMFPHRNLLQSVAELLFLSMDGALMAVLRSSLLSTVHAQFRWLVLGADGSRGK